MYSVIWDTKWQMNSRSNATKINSNCFQLQTDSKNRSQRTKPKFIPVNGTNKKCLVVVSALSDLSTSSINKKNSLKSRQTNRRRERQSDERLIRRWNKSRCDTRSKILLELIFWLFLPKKSHALVWISFITNYLST